jgi:hypothetical protein
LGLHDSPKCIIPAEVFDKRAMEKSQVVFHDLISAPVQPPAATTSLTPQSLPAPPPSDFGQMCDSNWRKFHQKIAGFAN